MLVGISTALKDSEQKKAIDMVKKIYTDAKIVFKPNEAVNLAICKIDEISTGYLPDTPKYSLHVLNKLSRVRIRTLYLPKFGLINLNLYKRQIAISGFADDVTEQLKTKAL
jgi:hypothetical protein